MKNKINNLKDWKLVNFAEIDKYAIKAYESIHDVDDSLNLGDVSNVDMDSVENFDCLFGGSPCLTGDQLITVYSKTQKNKKIPIKDIKIGDVVLTKSNTWHSVLHKFDNGVHDTCYVQVQNNKSVDSIHCTYNHKFFVRKATLSIGKDGLPEVLLESEPKFVEAKDLIPYKHFLCNFDVSKLKDKCIEYNLCFTDFIYKTNESNSIYISSMVENFEEVDSGKHTFVKWFPFIGLQKGKPENVYNMEVGVDHSYIVNGYVSKNCQDFSLAGKLKGSKWKCEDCGYEYNPIYVHYSQRNKCPKCQSENLSGTRSSLLVEYLRFVREKQPKFGIYENVKNIVGKKFKETFDLFISELEEYGYNVYWKVLNGKDYLIPQNRERVFVVYVRKDLDNRKFKFPEPIPLNLRLKDMLEKEVDDKYYLSDKQIERLSTTTYQSNKYENRVTDMGGVIGTLCARDYKDPKCVQLDTEKVVRKYGIFDDEKGKHQAGSVYDKECLCPTLDTAQGGYRMPLIEESADD